MKPPILPQWLLAVSATCQWQYSAVFGGADNEPTLPRGYTGGVNNSASGVLIRGRRLA
jgi:hypothetical protein